MVRIRRLLNVDVDTGEILEGTPILMYPRIRIREAFFMGFQQKLKSIAMDKELTGESLRVWLYMLSEMRYENCIFISHTEMAKDMGMLPPNTCRALRKLLSKGLILEGPKIGPAKSYRVSSDIAWKGKIKNLQTRRYEELRS